MLKLAPHGPKLAAALLAWAAVCCPGCGVAGVVEMQSDAQLSVHTAFLTLVVVVQAMLIVRFFTHPNKAAQAPQFVDVGVQICGGSAEAEAGSGGRNARHCDAKRRMLPHQHELPVITR